MSDDERYLKFLEDLRRLINASGLAPTEYLVASTVATIELLNIFLDACPTDQMRRDIRRALHAFPNALAQFIHAWQPGRDRAALEAAMKALIQKWKKEMATAEASTQRAATRRPW